MVLKDLFLGNGVVTLAHSYFSMGVIRGALEKNHAIEIIEESTYHMKCRILPSYRVFTRSMPVWSSILAIDLKYSDNGVSISYSFRWPEYYFGVAVALIMVFSLSLQLIHINHNIQDTVYTGIQEFLIVLCVVTFVIFCRNRVFAWQIRGILKDV